LSVEAQEIEWSAIRSELPSNDFKSVFEESRVALDPVFKLTLRNRVSDLQAAGGCITNSP